MPLPSTVVLLGAAGTGVQVLAAALPARLGPGAVRILCGHTVGDIHRCLAQPPEANLVLLMGLDLPCPAGQRPAQESADACLRAELSRAGMDYRVVYGQGEQRIVHALNAIKKIANSADTLSADGTFDSIHERQNTRVARLRAWNCEKCSDPECEHRLFSALTGREAGTAGK